MKTRITDLLGCQYPVIQGGMAWVAEYHLAAAVSEAGGIGLIGAASAPPEVVREQIRKTKELTDKPFVSALSGTHALYPAYHHQHPAAEPHLPPHTGLV